MPATRDYDLGADVFRNLMVLSDSVRSVLRAV